MLRRAGMPFKIWGVVFIVVTLIGIAGDYYYRGSFALTTMDVIFWIGACAGACFVAIGYIVDGEMRIAEAEGER